MVHMNEWKTLLLTVLLCAHLEESITNISALEAGAKKKRAILKENQLHFLLSRFLVTCVVSPRVGRVYRGAANMFV